MVEPIVLPMRISREFAQEHPEYIFLYGNDYLERGFFGQANYLGGTNPREVNCYRIPTLYKFCANPVFWTNSLHNHINEINVEIDKIPLDGRPIIPLRRIGQGGSRCMELAPTIYKYIMMRLDTIAYQNIIWQDLS